MCNHYLPPDTAGKPPVFLSQLTRSPQLSKTKNPWAKKDLTEQVNHGHTLFFCVTLYYRKARRAQAWKFPVLLEEMPWQPNTKSVRHPEFPGRVWGECILHLVPCAYAIRTALTILLHQFLCAILLPADQWWLYFCSQIKEIRYQP